MKQNALSIDFKDAHVNGNEYSFDYNIMASIVAATEITIQSFMGKSSVPVYFDRVNIRLYPISIDGYFTVGRYSLIFNATVSMDERVSAIESYLSSAVVYRTASGNPAVFSDGTAIDLKALSVTLVPTQSGSGDPSPDNVRPISGVSSVAVTRTGKNLFCCNGVSNVTTINGMTFTATKDQYGYVISISVNGTATGFTQYGMGLNVLPTPGDYILSGCPAGGSGSTYDMRYTNSYVDEGQGAAMTVPDGASSMTVYITIRNGVTMNNLVFRPMIRYASDIDSTFEAYQRQTVTVSLVDSNDDSLTVYGGALDVTTGALTVTHASKTLTSGLTYYQSTSTHYRFLMSNQIDDAKPYSTSECLSNIATNNSSMPVYLWIGSGINRGSVYISNSLVENTSDSGNAWLEENPLQIVYPLETPVTYNLTAQQLAALVGYNSVTTNGDSVYLEYLSSGPPWSS